MGVEPVTLLLQSKVILSWLHYTEVCLYGIEASSVFWGPEKGSFYSQRILQHLEVEPVTLLLQVQGNFSWFHDTEVCLYEIEASSGFWDPEEGSFYRPKGSPAQWTFWIKLILLWALPRTFCPYGVEAIFLGCVTGKDSFYSQKILQFFGLEPAILLLQSKMFLSWIQNTELSIYGTKAVSVFWGPEKNSFFSPVDRYQSPNLLGICHSLCLGQDFD